MSGISSRKRFAPIGVAAVFFTHPTYPERGRQPQSTGETQPMPKIIILSQHAHVRMAQRGISSQDIEYVRQHGRRMYINGAQARFLGWRDIPKEDGATHGHLEGTLVLLDPTGQFVITTYRNTEALKLIRKQGNIRRRAA
jgi:hypothetical protein